MERAKSIDEVLERLTPIIDQSRERATADGYFAALYRRVTAEVKTRVESGEFDDGERMAEFDVVFANRYLDAWATDAGGGRVSVPWQLAFSARTQFWPVVLQHLLLGMNAHINFDLGIAAATVAPGNDIHGLEDDFGRINAILASLVDEVQDRLARVWPPLRWLDHVAGGVDEAVVNFSMRRARQQAWSLALGVALAQGPEAHRQTVAEAEKTSVAVGRRVLNPGWKIGMILRLVRLFERGSVSRKLAAMGG